MSPEHRLCCPRHTPVAFEFSMSWKSDKTEAPAQEVGRNLYNAPAIGHRLGLVLHEPADGTHRLWCGCHNCCKRATVRCVGGVPVVKTHYSPCVGPDSLFAASLAVCGVLYISRQNCALVAEDATGGMFGRDSLVVVATGVGHGIGWLAGGHAGRTGSCLGHGAGPRDGELGCGWDGGPASGAEAN
jgi:hypothetical protein